MDFGTPDVDFCLASGHACLDFGTPVDVGLASGHACVDLGTPDVDLGRLASGHPCLDSGTPVDVGLALVIFET